MRRGFFPIVLLIFTASGFAGLIYESVWSHYLKLFLGHAAYAQTLVLAIFMGGMALGAWGCSRISGRWRDLLFAYAIIEALIGLAALAFHAVFNAVSDYAFAQIIPAIGHPAAVHAFKWTLAAVLILPQSVLLGMTFPLLTAGVVRLRAERSGHAIAMLYFTNSLGAGIGVLASGFYFIPAAGLPGTLIASGIINLAVAAAVILLPRKPASAVHHYQTPAAPVLSAASAGRVRLLLAVAALTGASSFMYEIGWIRMLALVLGSSTHAFELMLSAFILGLAFGGLWVRRRIDSTADTMRLLGFVQLAMGIAALATLPVYGGSFYVMQWLVSSLTSTEDGYVAFNIASHAIALAVMFPAAFCAGMTLPLITKTLLGLGSGERAIGQVYAANTAGSIIGVLVAVHFGLPLLGVKGLIITAAAIDLLLAVVLLGAAPGRTRRAYAAAAVAMSVVLVLGAAFGVQLDAHHMASGVYRHGKLIHPDRDNLVRHEDGKTSTVSVTVRDMVVSLRNNGKSDGSLNSKPDGSPTGDEVTMAMMGALPIMMMPDARRVANIGFGTGLTAHALLASDRLEVLDTIEIEPAVVRAARHFQPFNQRAFDDPRSRVHIEDAKTFFSSHQVLYDAIVSEPSNPWVSGVAGLFSVEFYSHVRRHLKPGGLFVQWIQLYEFSPELLASAVEALRPAFSDYVIYLSNHGDMIFVAANGGSVPDPKGAAFDNPAFAAMMERFHIRGLDDLNLHRVGTKRTMDAYFRAFGVEPNSDFFPIIDLNASKARFMKQQAVGVVNLSEAPLPLLDLFEPGYAPEPSRVTKGERVAGTRRSLFTQQAATARDYLLHGNPDMLKLMAPEPARELAIVRAALVDCSIVLPSGVLQAVLDRPARLLSAYLPKAQAMEIWEKFRISRCTSRLNASESRWIGLYSAVAARDAPAMAEKAAAILDAETELSADDKAYALASLMAGHTVSGQRALAVRAFRQHRGGLRPAAAWQPTFTFLAAHALGPIMPTVLSSVDNN
ncbi:MAG: Spermine synthase [Burkholderiales bacterium]|nr:Spermine synthase [Burkholderiales bacterium]